MSPLSSSNNTKKVCRTCMVIRMFLLAMLVLVIVGLLAREQMSYLSFITTWKLEKKENTNDPLQND